MTGHLAGLITSLPKRMTLNASRDVWRSVNPIGPCSAIFDTKSVTGSLIAKTD